MNCLKLFSRNCINELKALGNVDFEQLGGWVGRVEWVRLATLLKGTKLTNEPRRVGQFVLE